MEKSANLRIAATFNFLTAPISGAISYSAIETAHDTSHQIEGVGFGALTVLWLGLGAMNLYNSFDKNPADKNSTNDVPTLN